MAVVQFSIDDAFKKAWETFRATFGMLVLCTLIYVGVPTLVNMIAGKLFGNFFWLFLVYLAQLFLQAWLSVGFVRICLLALDGKPFSVDMMFSGLDKVLPFLLAWYLYLLGFAIGFLLLVVPGLIFGTIYGFFPFLMVEKNLKPIDAFNESARLTKGSRLQLFGFYLLILCFNALGALALLIGLLFTVPISMLAMAFVYRRFKST